MKLFKKGTNIPICDVVFLRTMFEKTKGLRGTETPYAVHFKTHFGIHTFGMKFPIDVLIFDGEMCVRAIKESLDANYFFFWNPLWGNVLELPEGTIQKFGIQKGDLLEFKE